MRTDWLLSGCLLLGLVSGAAAESVYRSVDADGRVTFSSTPPADAQASEAVELIPPLSEERQQAARERQQKLLDLASEGDRARAEEKAADGEVKDAAEQAVQAARKQLDEAKVIGRDDRLGGVGSGPLKPQYYERVRRAEQTLKSAERDQRLVRSGQK